MHSEPILYRTLHQRPQGYPATHQTNYPSHPTKIKHPLTDFRSDNAKEYLLGRMKQIYQDHHLTHHLHTPHQPQENCIAERFNRTVVGSVHTLLDTTGLDNRHWEDAARDPIFKYNLLHHSAINTSPYHMWQNAIPTLQRPFTFGL